MPQTTQIYETDGVAVVKSGTPESPYYTLADYLLAKVNFDIPMEVIVSICLDRDRDINEVASEVEKEVRDLCYADLLKWIVFGISKRGTVSDSDNGWSHSDGGYTLSENDKARMIKLANSIYLANGEETFGKTSAKIVSMGIRPADRDMLGNHIPHILR